MRAAVHSALVVFAWTGLAASSEFRKLGEGCCVPPEGAVTIADSFIVPEEGRCQDECTYDPECLAFEYRRSNVVSDKRAVCRLFNTSVIKTAMVKGATCNCNLKAAATNKPPEYQMVGSGHCVNGRNRTVEPHQPTRVSSLKSCVAHCLLMPSCLGFEYSDIDPVKPRQPNCVMVNKSVIAGQGADPVTCYTRTVATSRHRVQPVIQALANAPHKLETPFESRNRRVWMPLTATTTTSAEAATSTVAAEPVALNHQRSRREESSGLGLEASGGGSSGYAGHHHYNRLCKPTKDAFIKSDKEGNGGDAPGSGPYIVAGPPEEGWIIFGRNTGWWETWEIRKCRREGEHFIVIRSKAHDQFMTVNDEGVISLQLEHAGPDQEFKLEEYEQTSGYAAIATHNGLYFTFSPNGGLLATKRYWAGKFKFEPVPVPVDDGAEL